MKRKEGRRRKVSFRKERKEKKGERRKREEENELLQMVAIPVQERDSTPGPWYSMIAPVPPLTVKIPATLQMTSTNEKKGWKGQLRRVLGDSRSERDQLTLGSSPSSDLSLEPDSDDLRALKLPRDVGHNVDGIGSSNSTSDHTESSSVGSVRVGSDHESSGESVVLEDDLVDDTRSGLPESDSVLKKRNNRRKGEGREGEESQRSFAFSRRRVKPRTSC